jgi:CheY-like chemotaxis protein
MPHGGKLTIETANVTLDESYARVHVPLQPGEYVMVAISDTGVGMDNETQSRIFEPFFTTKGPKGTGLGLSTVYGIIKQSGGYVWVYSEPGRGTTFKIYLPRVNAVNEVASTEAAATLAKPERGKETILIVEDEPNLLRLTHQYLLHQGYLVLGAVDGASALQVAQAHSGPIDMLLTDVIMPGMNGHELAQKLLNLRPTVKVVYMSGYTENAIGHNGTLDQGITLLQKPFTLPALKEKVRAVLDSAPLPQEVAMSSRAVPQVTAPGSREKLSTFRAQRFNLHLPLRYRPVGEQSWRKGTTENISRSGMLFHAEENLQPNMQLEINLVLPIEIAGLAATEVVCRGEVVRTVEAPGSKVMPALAAKILQYHFQHGSRVSQA